MPELFVRFGGHAHAAGLTMEVAGVEEFRRRFHAFAASRLCADDFLRRLEIDAVLELREISEQAVDEIFMLAPFGHGNPPPLFAALGVEVAAPPTVMKEKHLRITVRQNGRTLVLKAWNLAHRAAELVPGARVDVAFNLEEDAILGCPRLSALGRNAAGFPAGLRRLKTAARRHFAARQFAAIGGLKGRGKVPPVFRIFDSGSSRFVALPGSEFRHVPCTGGCTRAERGT